MATSTSRPYARSVRPVDEAERAVEADGRLVGGVDEQHPDRDAACRERRQPGAGRARGRGRDPGGWGRRRSRRSRRARRARAGAWAGAPWSSRTRRARRRRTRAGTPRDRTTAPLAGAQHLDGPRALLGVAGEGAVVDLDPGGLVLAGPERAHGHAVGPAAVGRSSGSGTRICRSSRSSDEPGGRAHGVGVGIGVGAVHPVGDVARHPRRRPRRARRRAARRGRSGVSGIDGQLDRPLVGVVAREVRVARRPDVVEDAAIATVRPRACPSTRRRRAARCPSPPRPRRRGRGRVRRRRRREVAQHLDRAHAAEGSVAPDRRPTGAQRWRSTGTKPGVPSWVDLGQPRSAGRGRLLRRAVRVGRSRGPAGDRRLPRRDGRRPGGRRHRAGAEPRAAGLGHVHRGRERRRRRPRRSPRPEAR